MLRTPKFCTFARQSLHKPRGALAKVLDGDALGLVLDFVWGPVAETAFQALARQGFGEDSGDIKYVQIGALAGGPRPPSPPHPGRRIRVAPL